MNLPPSKPHTEMDALIAKAKAMPPMTPAELQAQRISFAFGNLPEGSTLTREDVAALDYARYGNLAELTARAEAAEAKSATLQATLDQTLHAWGEDAVKVEELQAQVVEPTTKLEAQQVQILSRALHGQRNSLVTWEALSPGYRGEFELLARTLLDALSRVKGGGE